jgi:uncharacterized iron-regulated membrane protein
MLRTRTVKLWYRIHKWTSLVCTAFLLLLCLTGLPLVFYEEIEHLLGNIAEPPPLPAGTPPAALDRIVAAGVARYPQEIVRFLSWDPDEPDAMFVGMAPSIDAPPDSTHFILLDARTAQALSDPVFDEGLMAVILQLHVDMFAGLPGKLFLGFMGLLFVIAIVSGGVVYGPFMRKLDFGTVRKHKARRLKWLDLHNLLGIVTLTWALVVGATGVINTWADLVIQLWRFDQLAAMTAPYQGKPPPTDLASLDAAVATASAAAPDMTPSFVAFPGSLFSSTHHYAVFMRGVTPLTERLIQPVLIDAETATFTDTREVPWYVTALLVSQPLHFGDYGGMPMKIIWAFLDIVTIIVLGSGLYLWLTRRRTPFEARLAELEQAEDAPAPALSGAGE